MNIHINYYYSCDCFYYLLSNKALPGVTVLELLKGSFLIPQVKELCAKADKLMNSHPADAAQIQQMKMELVSNWERIRALATNRYAKLKASYGSEIAHLLLLLPGSPKAEMG